MLENIFILVSVALLVVIMLLGFVPVFKALKALILKIPTPKSKDISYIVSLGMASRFIRADREDRLLDICCSTDEEKMNYIFRVMNGAEPEFVKLDEKTKKLIAMNALILAKYANEVFPFVNLLYLPFDTKLDISFWQFLYISYDIRKMLEKRENLELELRDIDSARGLIESWLLFLYPKLTDADQFFRDLIVANTYASLKYKLKNFNFVD